MMTEARPVRPFGESFSEWEKQLALAVVGHYRRRRQVGEAGSFEVRWQEKMGHQRIALFDVVRHQLCELDEV